MARQLLVPPHANLMEAPSGDMKAASLAGCNLVQYAAVLRGCRGNLGTMSSHALWMIVRDAGEQLDTTATGSIPRPLHNPKAAEAAENKLEALPLVYVGGYLGTASLWAQLNEWSKAARSIERGLQAYPGDPDLSRALGEVLAGRGTATVQVH